MLVSHWRSLEVTPFDRLHTSSYSSSIVTMAVSCTIFEIKRGIGKNGNLSYSLARSPILFAHNFNANCPNPWASKRCKNITEKFKYVPRMQQRHRWHTDDRRQTDGSCHKPKMIEQSSDFLSHFLFPIWLKISKLSHCRFNVKASCR